MDTEPVTDKFYVLMLTFYNELHVLTTFIYNDVQRLSGSGGITRFLSRSAASLRDTAFKLGLRIIYG